MTRLAPVVTALVVAAILMAGDFGRGGAMVWAVCAAGPLALAWLASAWGLGTTLRLGGVELAVGAALLILLDGVAGRLGLLATRWGAMALLAPGWILAGLAVRGALRGTRPRRPASMATAVAGHHDREQGWVRAGARLTMLSWSAPAIVVLLLASASAPGWLWATEFGGYDALSYHLALPREWLAAGRMAGLEHNVYSFLPSGLEAAYLHIFALAPDDAVGAVAAQFLHAALTIAAALTCAEIARRRAGLGGGILAAAAVLGTPWSIVTGSLGYNEMGVALMLAAGIHLLQASDLRQRHVIAVGLLAGTATACKLTSAGFVALPLLALLLLRARRPAPVLMAGAVAGVTLLPWLVANTAQTGNPVFPFATWIATGHWTVEQAVIWKAGHEVTGGLIARLAQAWTQLGRYGLGPNPDSSEPWAAQWLVLPWLAGAAAVLALRSVPRRRAAWITTTIVGVQFVLWIALTHVRSRFMLPAVVPMAWLVALGLAPVLGPRATRVAALAWCLAGVAVLAGQSSRGLTAALGGAAIMDGRVHASLLAELDADTIAAREARANVRAEAPATYWINEALPPGGHVLLVGEARSFYFDLARIAYQTTWDRGPFSIAMAEAPGDERAWVTALRARGFTHVLVDPDMLQIWETAGWNDPDLTASRVVGALEREAELVVIVRGRERIYALP